MSPHNPPPAVAVDDLHKSYGSVRAVAGASWSAHRGQVTAVLGSNGAGKTTTLECLEGLQRPDGGTVRVLGTDPWGAGPEHRARVGVMLQDGGLPNTRSAASVLTHLASLYAEPKEPDRLMAVLGITDFAATSIRRLSGGQRQRVALAAALVGRPEVAFLDEPTAGLDPHARLDVWDVIADLAEGGACVIVTTHSFDEAERLADNVVVMDGGAVVAHGPLTDLTARESLETAFFRLTRPGRPGREGDRR
ncbi:MAG: ABC transporter ATP-binding protein [Intrasporangiaceae bacterium]|nr:ABC transporter ATP-binding protein [Intrasporangiaceae bacterium]